mgnify:CR=1 FL=1
MPHFNNSIFSSDKRGIIRPHISPSRWYSACKFFPPVMQSATTLNGGSYPAGGTGSRARDLGLRAQKKLLGRVVSTGAGRSLLIDDATTSLLDNLYKLMERAAKANPSLDKKQPEKVLKNIVKLSIKVLVSTFDDR